MSGEKHDVSRFSQSPLIFVKLAVNDDRYKTRLWSNLGLIGLFTLELFALEC